MDAQLKELLEQYGYEYMSEHGDPDACPCEMDMLEEYTNFSPMEAIRRAFYGYKYNPYWDGKDEHLEEFNPNDDYFAFNGYANLVSISEFAVADWIADHIDTDEFLEWCKEEKYI